MTAMTEDVDDRFAGIDIDSLLNRTERRPFTYGRKKCLYEAPEFIQRLNGEETVLEGQSLCIECKVAGFPAPALRWYKDDEEILDHPRIHVESNGKGGYCLMIDHVNKGDEAAYRCRAENVEGASSCCFFLSVKGKPKSPKKKDGKSPNRRTVSFPPMFATIVEKVEEEEKQGKELKELPPSPMTEFYYALTLKSRQSWPTFVGDWAFVDGGHHEKRRTDSDERETKSAPTTPVSNGNVSDKVGLFLKAKEVNGKGVNRGQLKEMTKETKKRLDEEAAKREKENAVKRDQEKVAADKKREEDKKKVEAEEKIDEEQRKREDAMKLRRKTREDRRERDRKVKEEDEKKVAVNGDVAIKVNDGKSETFENKERLMREEENKKKEALVKEEERKRKEAQVKEEERKRKELEVEEKKKKDAQMIADEKRKKEACAKEDNRIKKEEKLKEENNKEVEPRKGILATNFGNQIKPLEEERQQKLKKESDIKRMEEERQQKLKKESDVKRLEEERQQKLKKESDVKRLEEERQQKLKKESDVKRLEEERQQKLKKESDIKRLEEERQQNLKKETNDSRAGKDTQPTGKPTPSPAPQNTEQATFKRVPAALQVFKNKESDPENTREKSPFKTQDTKQAPNIPSSLVSHKLDQQNQEKHQTRTNYKATDIPKDPQRATEKVSVSTPQERKDQPKDIRTQPLDASRQREKEQIDSMKQREQSQIEKLRETERQQIGALRQREKNQIDALRQREKEQIEALRKRQQEQRDATDQREKKQSSGIKETGERPTEGEKRPQANPPDVKQSEKETLKVSKQREDLKLREQQQIDELRAKEQSQRDALRLKERKQIHDVHRHEEQQKEEFRLKEIKLKEDLRSKQPQKQVEEEARKKEAERKKMEQRAREEKEEKQMEVRKEQIRKEQLRRQYDEDMRKRQAKLKAEDEKQRNERDKAERSRENGEQEGKNDDESQVKVHKRDYSFSELRKSLESHLGGEVMDEEEHKYWNNIMEKHAYSINDIKKAFDSISSEERPSRQRARRNSIEETELLNMKRSSSINELRESYTKSLGRPKKNMSELQKRQKDEEFLKRASSISDLRQQFLAVVQKQATSSRLLNVPGKQEAEITIRHMKLSDTVRPSEIRQRSKSPIPSPLYAAGSQSTAQNSPDNKPASRTQAELNKLAGAVAAKRASFHEMLAQKGEGVVPERSQKRMSYHGRDAYGSREISVYKRAAGWSDDIGSSPEVNESQLKSDTCSQASNASSSSSFSSGAHPHDTINSSYTTKVRPFVYNSVRTTARNSTGSIASDTYNFSSDEDVFTEDSSDSDAESHDSKEKPHFYIDDEGDGDCRTKNCSTADIIIYNRNAIAEAAFEEDGLATFVDNSANNNVVVSVAGMPEDKSPGSKCESGKSNLNVVLNSQNNVAPITPTLDNLNSQAQSLGTLGVSLLHTTAGVFTPQQDLQKRKETLKPHDGSKLSPEEDMSLIISIQGNVTRRSDSLMSTEIHSRGDRTPPIIVEMWDEVEEPRSPTLKSSESMRVPSTSRNAGSLFVSGYAREEREPTPFFKETDQSSQSFAPFLLGVPMRTSGHSDNVRIERESTPFFDERTKELNTRRDGFFPAQDSNQAMEGHKEFHRELTPFYDKKAVIHTTNSRGEFLDINSGLNNSKESKDALQKNKDTINRKGYFNVVSSLTAPSSSPGMALLETGGVLTTIPDTSTKTHANQCDLNQENVGITQGRKSLPGKGSSLKTSSKSLLPGKDAAKICNSTKESGASGLTTSKVRPGDVELDQHSGLEPGSRRETKAPSGNRSERRSRSETRQDRRQTVIQEVTVEAPKPRALSVPRDTSPTIAKISQDPVGVTFSSKSLDRSKAIGHSGRSAQTKQEKCKSKSATGSNQTKTTKVPKKCESINFSQSEKRGDATVERQSVERTQENGSILCKPTLLKIPASAKRNKKSSDTTAENGKGKSKINEKKIPVHVSQKATPVESATLSEKTGDKPKTTISSRLKKTMKGLLPHNPSDKAPLWDNNLEASLVEPPTCCVTKEESQAAVGKIKLQSKTKSITSSPDESLSSPGEKGPKSAYHIIASSASTASVTIRAPSLLFTPPPADTNMPAHKTIPKATVLPYQRVPQSVQQAEQPRQTPSDSKQSGLSGTRPKDSKLSFISGVFSTLFKSNHRNVTENTTEIDHSPGRTPENTTEIDHSPGRTPENTTEIDHSPGRTPENKRESKRRKLFAKDRSKAKSNGAGMSPHAPALDVTGPEEDAGATKSTPSVDLAKCSPFGRHTVEGLCFLFLMTMFCLSAQMPVEKFVCFVLASFYTFCVLRILGLVD